MKITAIMIAYSPTPWPSSDHRIFKGTFPSFWRFSCFGQIQVSVFVSIREFSDDTEKITNRGTAIRLTPLDECFVLSPLFACLCSRYATNTFP
jgi:hypothetical protein